MADYILVVDDEPIIRESISYVLKSEGYHVDEAANGREALDKIRSTAYDMVLTDLEMPEMKGIELLGHIAQSHPQTIVVIITAFGSLETAISALRNGASDYILKPLEFDELLIKIKRLLEYNRITAENRELRRELRDQYSFDNIIGNGPAMQRVFNEIRRVATTDSTVLITGKSGTGKELVARAIHFNGPRRDKPFITVNCGALPEALIESELFGHKRGAFTGAVQDKEGYFKAAEGGSVFLDEISEMPLQLQVRLLRVIQEREITPVGATKSVAINVRIIAATNRDMKIEIAEGKFREDLFYRLNVVEIHLPPLAERLEDIPMLVEHFMERFRKMIGRNIHGVDGDVLRVLMAHSWRGEIRELENTIERSMIFCDGETLSLNDLPPSIARDSGTTLVSGSLADVLGQFEKQFIVTQLRNHNMDKEAAAQSMEVSLATLYRRIKDLGITI